MSDKENQLRKCKKCGKELKASGGSTSGLHTHLSAKHNIDLRKRKLAQDAASTSAPLPKIKKTNPITDFFHNRNDKTLPAVLSRMTALDGMPFSVFVTSAELRSSLGARGFDVPKSATTTKNMVVLYAKNSREAVKKELTGLRNQGKRFCLTFDEWSSIRNRRYLNVNVHIEKEFWSLGLARVHGSMPAGKCIELFQTILKQFGLSYDNDIVSITTDGPSVMLKVGRLSNCDQQLCFAHAILLGVLDVLYKKPKTAKPTTSTNDENSSETDDASHTDTTEDEATTDDEEEDFRADFKFLQVKKMITLS